MLRDSLGFPLKTETVKGGIFKFIINGLKCKFILHIWWVGGLYDVFPSSLSMKAQGRLTAVGDKSFLQKKY